VVSDATFLRDKIVLTADVIAVQEPWKNELQHTSHQPATASFQLIYPAKGAVRVHDQDQHENQNQTSAPSQLGVCQFVSKRLDPSTW
jgi:hypothetical protein